MATEFIDHNSVIYSAGVGDDISFDLALMERFGVTIEAFDPTPRSIAWLRTQRLHPNFKMHELGVSDLDGEIEVFPPADPRHVSYSVFVSKSSNSYPPVRVSVNRLATIMARLGHEQIHVLKLDVEGAEYRVLRDICRSAQRPQQILVEFHNRFGFAGITDTLRAITLLTRVGYTLIAISDSGRECTFLYRGVS